jgi:predicted Zn-dependent peptidase
MFDIQPKIVTLSNGIRVVYLQEMVPVGHLGVTFLAGSRFESDNEIGLAHFLEHCIFKGTKKRKTLHILSRLDAVGGEINAYTTKEEICVFASFVRHHLNRAAELLADIAINSNFPEKEIEKEKEIVLDEINSYLDAPSDKIFDEFEQVLFPNHPLGYNILGTPETVTSFTQKDLQSYVDHYFYAENAVISFVGSTPLPVLLRILERHFSSMPSGKVKPIASTFTGYVPNRVRVQEGNYQAHAILGAMAPGYSHEDRRALTLLINILGGPALNSRLTLSVREKYGYSYNIEAHYTPYADVGYWSIYFGTDQKHLDKTLKVVYKELVKLRDVPLTDKQLAQAKEQLKGHIALSFDSNVGLMQGLGKSMLVFNQIDTIEEIYEGIDKLTIQDMQRVAQHYFQLDQISELVYEVKNGE